MNRGILFAFVVLSLALLFGCTGPQEVKCGDHKLGDRWKSDDGCNTCSCTANGAACTEMACVNTTGAPVHSASEVGAFLQKHLVVYYGLWNVDIPSPVYSTSTGEWTTDIKFTENDLPQVLRLAVTDSDLKVKEMWLKVLLNEEPQGIATIAGKVGCSENGRIKLIEFANPYCPNCVALEKTVESIADRFNTSVDYEYRVMLPSTNQMIQTYGYGNVSLTSKYYACIQNQSAFGNFRKCVMNTYSKQTGEPLAQNQLESCAIDTNVTRTGLASCVADADKMLGTDMKLGETYLGDYAILPSFVVDCRFRTTNPNLVKYAICYEFPETEGC